MDFNKVIIVGRLTRDPEMRFLPSGMPVTSFSLAVGEKYKKGDELVENTNFFDVVVFSKQAEHCNEYLSKGRPVLVEGKLRQNRWEDKDGNKRSKVEIVALSVIFLGSKSGGGSGGTSDEGGGDFQPVNDNDIPF